MTTLIDRMIAAGRPDDEIEAVRQGLRLQQPEKSEKQPALTCTDDQQAPPAESQSPFFAFNINGIDFFHTEAADRLRMVRDFSLAQCRAALQGENLQKTVRTAIERRMRKLEKSK